MKISYLITCHNETDTLKKLLNTLEVFVCDKHEILILDDFSDNPSTIEILKETKYKTVQHALNNNYGEHKNYGNSLCSGGYIFQIDGDEIPSLDLLSNIESIIDANSDVELFFVPRINDFKGVTEQHAMQWGWKLDMSPIYKRFRVNWPDYQSRIYLNEPSRIKWDRRLHEKIEGHHKYSFLPADEDFALYHDKTIEKQIETNLRYNKQFTEQENKGHGVT